MIAKIVWLSLIVLCSVPIYGLELTEEHRSEIAACWQRIWHEESEDIGNKSGNYKHYRDALLSFTDEDVMIAEKYIACLLQEPSWSRFMQQKDLDSTLEFIHSMTNVLQQTIDSECYITFPPHMSTIADEATRTTLDEDVFLTRLRQAFLAFTIVVSHMDYLCREGLQEGVAAEAN